MNVDKLKQHHDLLRNELIVCKRRLESKCEALAIISSSLEECRREKEQLKLFLEQMHSRYQWKKPTVLNRIVENIPTNKSKINGTKYSSTLEANFFLRIESDEAKQKLKEALEDAKLLREQLGRHRMGSSEESLEPRYFPAHERQDLVSSLESNQDRLNQLERDLQQVLDEKEELICERDVYKDKYERLNQHLNQMMGSDGSTMLDIDAVLAENKYLQERVRQVEDEKSVAMATICKYKSIVERPKTKNITKFGQPRDNGIIVTQKQVQHILYSDNILENTPETLQDLRALCISLLESTNDKKVALQHQKRTNKVLAERITELEAKFKKLGSTFLPSRSSSISRENPSAESPKPNHLLDLVDKMEVCDLRKLMAPEGSAFSSPSHALYSIDGGVTEPNLLYSVESIRSEVTSNNSHQSEETFKISDQSESMDINSSLSTAISINSDQLETSSKNIGQWESKDYSREQVDSRAKQSHSLTGLGELADREIKGIGGLSKNISYCSKIETFDDLLNDLSDGNAMI